MAGELQLSYQASKTVYTLLRNRVGQIWSTSGGTGGFAAYLTASYADYAISLTEQGSASAFYAGNMPAAMPAGVVSVVGKQQLAGSVAESDPSIAVGDIQWNGTVTLPLADLATSGQLGTFGPIRMARGQAISGFCFDLVSAADHVTPLVSGVVSGQISRDGGSFGVLQSGTFSEIGLGFYRVNLTSGDLNAGVAAVVFTANGISGGSSDPRRMAFVLQRTSGF